MRGSRKPRVLVIDDEMGVARVLEQLAGQLGFDVLSRANGEDGLQAVLAWQPDMAFVDFHMPGLNGVEVVRAIRAANPECAVAFMSGDVSIDVVIAAVKAGALDCLPKPFPTETVAGLLAGVKEAAQTRARLLAADAAVATAVEFQGMIGRTRRMQDMFTSIRRLAPHARAVLLTGETGTGKELAARAFHALSHRKSRKYVTVNCSAIVETLFESELFGHMRGAFTGAVENKPGLFEHAHDGTLFLDEIGELPLALQPKLLRVLESGEVQRVGALDPRVVDVQVIAATNVDLRSEVAAGRFRSDLYYRLGVIEIELPPLRDRREDIPYLTASILRDCARRLKRPVAGVSDAAERVLRDASWPGNIRELRNVLERASLMSDARLLSERDIASAMQRGETFARRDTAADPALLSTAEREQVRRALLDTRGNKAAAARQLGVSRRALYRWLDRLEIH